MTWVSKWTIYDIQSDDLFKVDAPIHYTELMTSLTFNSPRRIVHFRDVFPFWAKMIIVFMTSCNDFYENFPTQNQEHEFLFYDKHFYF